MTDMLTYDSLMAGLDASPDDWTLRKVLADFFEESGEIEKAMAVRWMVDNKRRPCWQEDAGNSTSDARRTNPTWYKHNRDGNIKEYFRFRCDPESDLPDVIFYRLPGRKKEDHQAVYYHSLREAEEAFVTAWVRAHKEGLV